jgi:hypothetical protein
MLAPPLDAGALKAMLTLALPAVAEPMVGVPGTVALLPLPPPPQATKPKAHKAAHNVFWLEKRIFIFASPVKNSQFSIYLQFYFIKK